MVDTQKLETFTQERDKRDEFHVKYLDSTDKKDLDKEDLDYKSLTTTQPFRWRIF